MNVSLAGILARVNSESTNQTDAANAASVSHVAKNMHTAMVLDSLRAGQTISGQVKAINGAQILLDMGNGVELGAKLEGSIDVSAGKSLLFEVKSNANGKVLLSPLHTNLSADENAVAGALKAAGMPLTQSNMQMVKSMMDEGMSIDRNSLWSMGKQVSAFPEASPDTIVRLSAMGMEINNANIAGFEAVRNMQHQLLYTMEDFSAGMMNILQGFSENGQIEEGAAFLKEMLGLLPNQETQIILSGGQEILEALQMEPGAEQTGAVAELQNSMAEQESNTIQQQDGIIRQQDGILQADSARQNVQEQSLSQSENRVVTIAQVKGQLDELLQAVKQLKEAPDSEQEKVLFDKFESLSKSALGLLKRSLSDEWTIKPEDFAEKELVKELYKKISEQSQKLQDFLGTHDKMDTSAGKAVNSIQQNLQFMESVNQAFPYLQIPLKASMENAHGDLYVYSRKNGRVSEDGSRSALLHLEMQHLGNMDIYVKLKDQNVSTQFMLENESILDFLEQHMDLLSARLEKKGYHLNTEVKHHDFSEDADGISKIRGIEKKDTVISYTSFDVRA